MKHLLLSEKDGSILITCTVKVGENLPVSGALVRGVEHGVLLLESRSSFDAGLYKLNNGDPSVCYINGLLMRTSVLFISESCARDKEILGSLFTESPAGDITIAEQFNKEEMISKINNLGINAKTDESSLHIRLLKERLVSIPKVDSNRMSNMSEFR